MPQIRTGEPSRMFSRVEVEWLWPRLTDASGAGTTPQLLMRFGYGETANPSVRRPVEDVLI